MPGLPEDIVDRVLQARADGLFGVLPDHDPHPLRALRDAGVRMTLGTDDPLQLGTTIAGEYEAAAATNCCLTSTLLEVPLWQA